MTGPVDPNHPLGGTEVDGDPPSGEDRSAWRGHRRLLAFSLSALLAGARVAGGVTSGGSRRGSALVARASGPAKDFTLDNLQPAQAPVSLASLRGRPVVVNFWASWCVPCRKEMPALEAVDRQGRGRVAFVGVNDQDGRRAALEFVAETQVSYPSGYDPEGKVAASYGLFGLPTTLFISAQGRLLERRTGAITQQELRTTIARLFGARVLA